MRPIQLLADEFVELLKERAAAGLSGAAAVQPPEKLAGVAPATGPAPESL